MKRTLVILALIVALFGLLLLIANWSSEDSQVSLAVDSRATVSTPCIAATLSYSEVLTIAATDIWSLPTPIHTPVIPTERPFLPRPTPPPITPHPTPTFLPDRGVRMGEARELMIMPDASFPLLSLPRLIYASTDGKTLVGVIRPDKDTRAVVAIDIASGELRVLYEAQFSFREPRVSGKYVVWSRLHQLYFYDLEQQQLGELASGLVLNIRVSGDFAVWEQDAVDIWGYDFNSKESFPVAARPDVLEALPEFSGEWVVYYSPTRHSDPPVLRASNIQTQEDILLGEFPRYYSDDPYRSSLYVIDAPWVVWSAKAELRLYNLDTRTPYTVTVEPCISSVTALGNSPRRLRPEKLALSGDVLVFSCAQRMGYDIERDVFFSLPLYTPEIWQMVTQGQMSFTGWTFSNDQLVWVLTEDVSGPQERSYIYTARIERSP